MINKDNVTDLILKTGLYMNKKGQDMAVTQDLVRSINQLFEDDGLQAIYLNSDENINVPDVAVIPLYSKDFGTWAMNPNDPDTCPFGYTLEIKASCFRQYTSEELAAVIIHDILQNIQSDMAKIRFIKAYDHAISLYKPEMILEAFTDISTSEVVFMIFMQICCRPFRVPVGKVDHTGTDDVMFAIGLGDAYDSYLNKIDQTWKFDQYDADADIEDRINKEIEADYRDAKTVIDACLDNDIRHYYQMIRDGVPLIKLNHLMGDANKAIGSLGFISRPRRGKYVPVNAPTKNNGDPVTTITESFINPKTEVELRFKIDQIISEMRYAESEAEREIILFKIKNLTLKMTKTKMMLDKKLEKNPSDNTTRAQMKVVLNLLDELEMLRDKCVKMEIKQKVWRVYSKVDLPEGYQF